MPSERVGWRTAVSPSVLTNLRQPKQTKAINRTAPPQIQDNQGRDSVCPSHCKTLTMMQGLLWAARTLHGGGPGRLPGGRRCIMAENREVASGPRPSAVAAPPRLPVAPSEEDCAASACAGSDLLCRSCRTYARTCRHMRQPKLVPFLSTSLQSKARSVCRIQVTL